jgi:hypothetical protein
MNLAADTGISVLVATTIGMAWFLIIVVVDMRQRSCG